MGLSLITIIFTWINLVLIGMMGAAKTSTGKLISKKLNMPFFDCDEV